VSQDDGELPAVRPPRPTIRHAFGTWHDRPDVFDSVAHPQSELPANSAAHGHRHKWLGSVINLISYHKEKSEVGTPRCGVRETAQRAVATIYEIASSALVFTVRRPSTLARGREPY